MLKKIKAAKRRTVQKNLERMGKAEGIKDPEYDEALKNFRDMEEKLSKLQSLLKDSLNASKQYTARQAALASQVGVYFVDSVDGELPLETPSKDFVETFSKAHCQVGPCVNNTLTEDISKHIQEILSEEFPALKKEIHEHDSIRTDVESYRRRVKHMQEKGKPGNDPDLIKFSEKLAKAQSVYTELHANLMSKLRNVHETRHAVMTRDFLTLLASQLAFHRRIADALGSIVAGIPTDDATEICSTVDGRISSTPYDASNANREESRSFMGRLRGLSLSKKRRSSGHTSSEKRKSNPPVIAETMSVQSILPISDTLPVSEGSAPVGAHMSLSSVASTNSGNVASFAPPPGMEESSVFSAAAVGAPPPPGRAAAAETATALYNYDGADENDLTFIKGDTIEITEKIDEGWWRGKIGDGPEGLFPSNYVKVD